MASGSVFGARKSLTKGSKSGLLSNTLINFFLPFPNNADTLSQPLKACKKKYF
jgi:hypothetical protein